jgi:hypothetical protein
MFGAFACDSDSEDEPVEKAKSPVIKKRAVDWAEMSDDEDDDAHWTPPC